MKGHKKEYFALVNNFTEEIYFFTQSGFSENDEAMEWYNSCKLQYKITPIVESEYLEIAKINKQY